MAETANLEIEKAMHDMLWANSPAQSDAVFDGIVAHVDLRDLQAARIIETEHQRDQIMQQFMADPAESIRREVKGLAEIYHRRASVVRFGAQVITEYVTRTPDEQSVDALYRRVESPGGDMVAIYARLQGTLEEPCTFRVAANGQLSVTERYWRRGGWRDVERSTEPGQRGDTLLRMLFASTIWAADLTLDKRSGEQNLAADQHAKQMLYRHKRQA